MPEILKPHEQNIMPGEYRFIRFGKRIIIGRTERVTHFNLLGTCYITESRIPSESILEDMLQTGEIDGGFMDFHSNCETVTLFGGTHIGNNADNNTFYKIGRQRTEDLLSSLGWEVIHRE